MRIFLECREVQGHSAHESLLRESSAIKTCCLPRSVVHARRAPGQIQKVGYSSVRIPCCLQSKPLQASLDPRRCYLFEYLLSPLASKLSPKRCPQFWTSLGSLKLGVELESRAQVTIMNCGEVDGADRTQHISSLHRLVALFPAG